MDCPDIMLPKKAINLLLLGRNGNGKSSTGNSILGRREFTPSSNTSAGCEEETIEKLEKQKKETEFPNTRITLVEGPGLGDANLDSEEDVRLTFQKVETSLRLCSEGFEVILFVLKYGVRFTQQEKETVLLVKRIFGERVFVEHGLVVMTHGDSFEQDMEDEDKTFEDWCREQTGDIQALLAECDYRVILFNNRRKDDAGQEQVARLLEMVKAVPGRAHPYALNNYLLADKSRRKLLLSSKLPKLEKETNKILDDVHAQINLLNFKSLEENKKDFVDLYKKLDDQKQVLLKEDGELGMLKNALRLIDLTEFSLKTKVKIIMDTHWLSLQTAPLETHHFSEYSNDDSRMGWLYSMFPLFTWSYWFPQKSNLETITNNSSQQDTSPIGSGSELHEDSQQEMYSDVPRNPFACESFHSDDTSTKHLGDPMKGCDEMWEIV